MNSFFRIFVFITFFGSIILSLAVGELPFSEAALHAMKKIGGNASGWSPLLDERVPRVIVLLSTGASLATAGAVMQALFANPLAAPSVLGISSGASLAGTLVLISGLNSAIPFLLPFSSIAGAFITLFLIFLCARQNGGIETQTLILTGIALSTLLIAAQSTLTYAFRDRWEVIQTITEWEAGTTQGIGWRHVHMQLPVTLAGLFGSLLYKGELNLLSLGDEDALALGVDVGTVRFRLLLSVALLVGGSIAAIGSISFIGLIVPHILRQLTGPSNQKLIPSAALSGAAILTGADTLLRHYRFYSLTLGNLFALFGGLFFLGLLIRFRNSRREEVPC